MLLSKASPPLSISKMPIISFSLSFSRKCRGGESHIVPQSTSCIGLLALEEFHPSLIYQLHFMRECSYGEDKKRVAMISFGE